MKKSIALKSERSPCPIATTLDVVGDKWSLLITRDMLNGKKRFGEFQASPEGIPTNILAARLKRMEQTGLIARTPYQDRPPRFEYQLTRRGLSLLPVLREMCRWANSEAPGTWPAPEHFMSQDTAVP